MKVAREDILLGVAKLLWKYEISINDLYETLGVDLENYRVDANREIAELAGILRGWQTQPENEE
ncbi:hypothetical protein RXV86_18175 [Alisedimentitalea sp. MJ-SS2]|uniref:hypothetical protein n=1 Tax=Aliisedimentitalea sp. MJ-SS2 TaxID=3049795 RepID=UPI0029148089|nr:hypothetical protein [Alisedimentitalea sp. MJ-SS2]MDU8929324.1 hypothetical protein [Alisedimentitalea sp. MJ-SS2]